MQYGAAGENVSLKKFHRQHFSSFIQCVAVGFYLNSTLAVIRRVLEHSNNDKQLNKLIKNFLLSVNY